MRRIMVLLTISLFSFGCATGQSRWELAAMGAAVVDLGSTGGALDNGFKEANPVYGQSPSVEKMLALNAGVYAGVWYLTKGMQPETRQKVWRNVALIRLAAAAWNLSQNGCACFKISF